MGHVAYYISSDKAEVRTYRRVMSHVYMDESCRINGWVMSHKWINDTWMRHVTWMHASCVVRFYFRGVAARHIMCIHGWVMSHQWMSHVTCAYAATTVNLEHTHESCHVYALMSQVAPMDESRHMYIRSDNGEVGANAWVVAHVCMHKACCIHGWVVLHRWMSQVA